MADQVVQHGLEGVIAFETEIAEPDREGGALRYRGVDIEELVGFYDYGHVWGLLVDGSFDPGLPPAEPFPIPVHSGYIRAMSRARLRCCALWGLGQLLDSTTSVRDDLRVPRDGAAFVAQSLAASAWHGSPKAHRSASTITGVHARWRGDPIPTT